ncbi:hypothetical protein [Nocardiopsis prasina]|uniref:hypothetical protein n=1 Tax=Nocardiopsis prasina TaxID=2015 RepID=UPI00034C13B9|nr:hypothetical protein [Nocardiopsis prasina]
MADVVRVKSKTLGIDTHEAPSAPDQRSDKRDAEPAEPSVDRTPRRKRQRKPPEKDPLTELRQRRQREQERFVEDVRASRITAPGQTPQDQHMMLNNLHQRHVSTMVDLCLRPLRNKVTPKRVIATVGVAAAMWMLSPRFRSHVGEQAARVADALGVGRGGRAQTAPAPFTPDGPLGANGSPPWGRNEQPREASNDSGQGPRSNEQSDREPYTEESAALAHVGIAQNAYDEMRRPGADQDLIRQNYRSALDGLYRSAEADGLSREAIRGNMRAVVGQMIERDPSKASVFSGFAHGGDPGTSGPSGGEMTTDEAFTVREPMNAAEHRAAAARTMHEDLSNAHGLAEFDEVVKQYYVGSFTREHPDLAKEGRDPAERARLKRSQSMFASMSDDGLSIDEQGKLHRQALVETLQHVDPQWERRLRDLDDRVNQARENPRGPRTWAEPGPGAQPDPEDVVTVEAEIVDAEIVDEDQDAVGDQGPASSVSQAVPKPPGPSSAVEQAQSGPEDLRDLASGSDDTMTGPSRARTLAARQRVAVNQGNTGTYMGAQSRLPALGPAPSDGPEMG